MISFLKKKILRKNKKYKLNLHETYMDGVWSDNSSVYITDGKLKKNISSKRIRLCFYFFITGLLVILYNVFILQFSDSEYYQALSQQNAENKLIVFPVRGVIFDRNGERLAWNTTSENGDILREYVGEGFSSLLGFIRYPQKDRYGNYYRIETEGVSGIERAFDYILAGGSGSFVREKTATGDIVSELYFEEQSDGDDIYLTIDKEIQNLLYQTFKNVIDDTDYSAAAGVLLEIDTGDVLSLVSVPDYDNNKFTDLDNENLEDYIKSQETGSLLNRAVSGLYIPGSSIKPFFGVAALEEEIVTATDVIKSTGSIVIQNLYDENITYTFRDRKFLGSLNIYDAIAQSSNVYFYTVGGGHGELDGLGIDRLNFYAKLFGLGRKTNIGFFEQPDGLVPNPEWKEERYDEKWTLGDTYNTSIGQYDFQVTPLQLARAIAAIGNNGFLIEPNVLLEEDREIEKRKLGISQSNLEKIRDAMRKVITEGTASRLDSDKYTLAAKSGTSQIIDDIENSLLIGFFPYNDPKYSFSFVFERGTDVGSLTRAVQIFFNEISENYSDKIELK